MDFKGDDATVTVIFLFANIMSVDFWNLALAGFVFLVLESMLILLQVIVWAWVMRLISHHKNT